VEEKNAQEQEDNYSLTLSKTGCQRISHRTAETVPEEKNAQEQEDKTQNNKIKFKFKI